MTDKERWALIEEKHIALAQNTELLQQMHLDNSRRNERLDREYKAIRLAIVHAVHNKRYAIQEEVDRIDSMIEEFFQDLESGETGGNGGGEKK